MKMGGVSETITDGVNIHDKLLIVISVCQNREEKKTIIRHLPVCLSFVVKPDLVVGSRLPTNK